TTSKEASLHPAPNGSGRAEQLVHVPVHGGGRLVGALDAGRDRLVEVVSESGVGGRDAMDGLVDPGRDGFASPLAGVRAEAAGFSAEAGGPSELVEDGVALGFESLAGARVVAFVGGVDFGTDTFQFALVGAAGLVIKHRRLGACAAQLR